jgi:hypothetical protein
VSQQSKIIQTKAPELKYETRVGASARSESEASVETRAQAQAQLVAKIRAQTEASDSVEAEAKANAEARAEIKSNSQTWCVRLTARETYTLNYPYPVISQLHRFRCLFAPC